jgi:hypothetical protein
MKNERKETANSGTALKWKDFSYDVCPVPTCMQYVLIQLEITEVVEED